MRDWSDEPFVKFYTRPNPDWIAMPWQAKAVLALALKGKFDRAGYLDLGRRGVDGIGAIVGLPDDVALVGVKYLIEVDKCWRLVPRDDRMWIFWPNYYPAQMAAASASTRKAMQRERDRARGAAEALSPDQVSAVLNGGQESLQLDTPGSHASESRGVTAQSHDQTRREEKRSDQQIGSGKSPFLEAQERICAAFLECTGNKYLWQGAKDSTALKNILSVATPDEIERTFRVGLRIAANDPQNWKAVTSVAQLYMKWNDLISATKAQSQNQSPERNKHLRLLTPEQKRKLNG